MLTEGQYLLPAQHAAPFRTVPRLMGHTAQPDGLPAEAIFTRRQSTGPTVRGDSD
jgi:hypothetical protein